MGIDIAVFNRVMDKGEYMEWVGKAEPFKLSDAATKKSMNLRLLICAAAAVIVTGAYLISIASSGIPLQAAVPVITVVVPLFIIIRPALDKRAINKKLIFALTNKRAIAYKSETDYASMALDKIDEVKFTDNGNGVGNVLLGSVAVNAPESKHRYIALMPKSAYKGEEKYTTGMVFYNVSDMKKIRDLLDKRPKTADDAAAGS